MSTNCFSSHLSQICTSVDPRLTNKAVYDRPFKYGIKDHTSVQNFFRPLVTAEEVCKGVNLEGKVVVVTGANSGLGKCLSGLVVLSVLEGYFSHW